MKVRVQESEKINKKQLAIYIIIVAICIISVIIAFYVQFYSRIDIGRLTGIIPDGEWGNKTEEQVQVVKTEFDDLFTNTLQHSTEQTANLVTTAIQKKETKLNCYDIEIHIPQINIDNEIGDEFNKNIEIFTKKAQEILKSENKNIIYTVEYTANIYDDILSVMIRSNLKEGSSGQRVIIETYHYDLRNNKKITLEEILKIGHVDLQEVEDYIKSEIELEQRKVEELKKLGYNIYSRDTSSSQYKIMNTKEFYVTEETIYIIYPYGNETFTNEMDLIVI